MTLETSTACFQVTVHRATLLVAWSPLVMLVARTLSGRMQSRPKRWSATAAMTRAASTSTALSAGWPSQPGPETRDRPTLMVT